MTRAEYMEGLAKALKDYDEDFALDIIHRVSDVKFERKGETIFVKKQ